MRRLLKRAWLVGLVAAFCGSSQASAAEIKIAIFPSNDPAKLNAVMAVLSDYLSERTGDRVSAVVTRDYAEIEQRLRENSVDIAWLNTLNYVRLTENLPSVRYLATYMEKNETTGEITPYYRSYIVARKDGDIRRLDDVRGKRFAFTDTASTSGYLFPLLILEANRIDPARDFAKVFYLKRHDRVIEALLQGSIDAGAVSDGTYFTAVRNHGEVIEILAESAPIPLDAIVAAERLDPKVAERVRAALLAMPADHPFCRTMRETLGWNAAGFAVRDDAFYNPARAAYGRR